MRDGAGWSGSVRTFLGAHPEDVQAALQTGLPPSASQATAWEATILHLRSALDTIVAKRPEAYDWLVVLEYELPREGGRRPDLCIVTDDALLVVEVKNQAAWEQPNIEQLRAYVRDFQHYHAQSHGREVSGALWVLAARDLHEGVNEVRVVGANCLGDALHNLTGHGLSDSEASGWLRSEYRPLPRLVQAARYLFENEPLPQIRSAKSAGIPQTMAIIRGIVEQARRDAQNHLILLSGPPGSGKTLVGLQAVYDHVGEAETTNGIYLSGNGPLIQVLQHVLASKVFVQDVHRFIREYGIRKRGQVPEDFLVFDEAQRAWNAEKIAEFYTKKNVQVPELSEPQLFISAADVPDRGMTVLALIGTGQEIHSGEQSGIGLWADALMGSSKDWFVHGPPSMRPFFKHTEYNERPELNLGLSLRSHAAEDLHAWADAFLAGQLEQACQYAERLKQSFFSIHVTDSLHAAKQYLQARYEGEPEKTYGMICSSKARNLAKIGVDVGMFGAHQVRLNRDEAAWYAGNGGSVPECRKLEKAATEFTCQGLELDGTLILWGYDYVWTGTEWESRRGRANPLIPDPHALRQNAYRVLLTRARDGFVVVVPADASLKNTREALLAAGATPLSASQALPIASEAAATDQ